MGWMKNVADNEHHLHNTTEAMEMDIQKRVWDATTGRRLSRSRSKSKNIMERARSFERAAADAANAGGGSANSSRAPSRQGSSSNIPNQMRGRRRRSPSAGRQMQMADFWQNEVHQQQNVSRPSSRAGRDRSVGRVDTSQWEANMEKAKDKSVPPKTPPPKRRQMKPPSPCGPRDEDPRSPSPPAPPPPPRNMSSRSKAVTEESLMTFNTTNADLSEATIQTMSQEEKEQFVDQWVRQTSTQEARDELEQFAYEIAESVVSTMERSHSQQQVGEKVTYIYQ